SRRQRNSSARRTWRSCSRRRAMPRPSKCRLRGRPSTMARPLRIAIVGAGLGGLVAAISARRAGFEATIYEQASAFGEVGAGIQVGPNAVKVLRALGLEAGLAGFGAR